MSTITTRVGKGSALSYAEMDANFVNLNTDKLEAAALVPYETSANAAATYLTQTSAATIYETKTNVAAGLATKSDTTTTVTKDSSTGAAHIPSGTSAQRPESPTYGDQRANSTTNAMEWWNGAAWAPMGGGAPAGFRNKIINGAFGINQRGYVSGAATSAGQYTLDRWKVTGTGGITFSTVNNKTTVTIPAGQTLQQVIEWLNLATGDYVLSWEGTAQGRIGAGSYGASGSVGASITGGTNTTIEFNTGTVANVQLEAGSIATPFEHRPYGTELALCQRYYEVCAALWSGNVTSATTYQMNVPFAVEKRAAPTITSLVQSGILNGSFNVRSGSASGTRAAVWGGQSSATISAAGYTDSFSASAEL